MPNRILRAEILGSDRVNALSMGAELFYRRLMSVVDDYGRFNADWRILQSALFPLRTTSVTEEQIKTWLAECSRLLEGEDEPLLSIYPVGRKKFLQINNFGQRIRSESKFPAPVIREREKRLLPSVSTPRTSAARARGRRASTPLSPPTPTSHTTPTPGANGSEPPEKPNGHPPRGLAPRNECREQFDRLAAEYPPEGRDRSKQAYAAFAEELASENERPPDEVVGEMLASVQRYRAKDFRWQSGRVHSLRTFLAEGLWREEPHPVATAERARSPGPTSKAAARKALLESVTLEEKTYANT